MRRHRPPERPSAAGIRIKSPRARFDRLSGWISGTRTDTPPSGSSPRRRKATQRGLSKRPRFTQIRGRFFAPEFPAAQVRHPLIPPAPQDSSPPPRRRRLQFRAHGTAGRNSEPAEPQVAPSPQRLKSRQSPQRRRLHQAHGASSRAKALSDAGCTKPTAPQVAPSPRRLKSRQSPQRRRSHQARSASSRAKALSAACPTLFPCAAGRTKALRTAGPTLFPAPQVATPS